MDHCLCTWLSKDQQFRWIFDIHVYIYTLFFEFFFFFFPLFCLCVCVCVCKFQIFKRNLTNLLHNHIFLCATLLYYFQVSTKKKLNFEFLYWARKQGIKAAKYNTLGVDAKSSDQFYPDKEWNGLFLPKFEAIV